MEFNCPSPFLSSPFTLRLLPSEYKVFRGLLMVFKFLNIVLLVCVAASLAEAQPSATATPATPDLQTIVSRMMRAQEQNRVSSRAITVRRDYQLLDKGYEQK